MKAGTAVSSHTSARRSLRTAVRGSLLDFRHIAATPVAIVLATAAGNTHAALAEAPGPRTTEPFQAYVGAGASYEDNLFRFSGSGEAEETFGTDTMDDRYGRLSAGFSGQQAGEGHRYEYQGEINHRSYDEFDFLDYTGGSLTGFGEWELRPGTAGSLLYDYQRSLQDFTNKVNSAKDVVEQHRVDGAVKQSLAQRWQLRVAAGYRDLDFSTSDFLSKKRTDAEIELRYAASQQSVFGLLTTYTTSDYDLDDERDFKGYSIGPVFEWQLTTSTQLSANVGYTHRGLDSGDAFDDYDGVTGFVAAQWQPGDRFRTDVRVFRDVSSLGGEISEYTERTGLQVRPTWQLTPKVTSRFVFEYEQRDFSAVDTTAEDREDDYLLADLGFDYAATQKLTLTLAYGFEHRDSNLPEEDFDAHLVHLDVRFDI